MYIIVYFFCVGCNRLGMNGDLTCVNCCFCKFAALQTPQKETFDFRNFVSNDRRPARVAAGGAWWIRFAPANG